MYQKIEINFPVAVALPAGWEEKLDRLVAEVCQKYESEHPDRVMWPMGCGAKINWSQADAAFLGRTAAPGAPAQGEPDHDDSIYEVTVSERERYDTDPISA
ncbi:MAG TPA: hypothetical protein VK178_07125 [Opitutaceae bacterium]|nr:hypothetical protein [Opitutaceae bacterium]